MMLQKGIHKNRSKGHMLKTSLAALVAGTALSPVAAQAQDNDLDSFLETIMVTAQKRSENLQDVPITVAALTAETIERQQIFQLDDIEYAVPNFSLRDIGQRASTSLLFIRGLGNGFQTQTLRTTVVLDGVPLGNTRGLNGSLFDVQQVEVLKGPQSTLYGLTAEAGAVVITTRKPGDELRANASATITNNDRRIMGSVSGPVIEDVLSLGVAAAYDNGDGFVDNVIDGSDFDQTETASARFRAIFTPTESLEFDLVYQYQNISDDFGQNALPLDRADYNAAFGVNVGEFETAQPAPGFNDIESHSISLRAEYNADSFDVVSVSSYVDLDTGLQFDINLAPGLFFGTFESGIIDTQFSFFSQELRVQSNGEGPFQWLAGVNYYDRNFDRQSFATTPFPLSMTMEGDRFIVGRDAQDFKYQSISGFGQASYDVLEDLKITVGARYESVDTRAITVSNGFADLFGQPKVPDGTEFNETSDAFLPRASVDYKVNDDVLVYFTAARGWLPAGFNAAQTNAALFPFEAETLWNYEIGVKTTLFDERVRFNASVYQMNIDNYQEQVRSDPLTFFIDNIDGVRIRGVDVDFTASITDTFQIGGSLGYNSPVYTDFVEQLTDFMGNPVMIDNTGNELPGTPQLQYTFNATWYFLPEFYARLDYRGSGDFRPIEDRGNTLPIQDGYNVLNMQLGYEGERFGATFFVNNLTDSSYDLLVLDQSGDGRLFGVPGEGIEVGGSVSFRF